MKKYRVKGLIFDLDGTLVDSYTPIAESLNHVLQSLGIPALSKRRVKRMVGHGLEELIRTTAGEKHVRLGVKRFREKYRTIYLEKTTLLSGVRTTLRRLHAGAISMAIATNKPAYFSEEIIGHLGLGRYFPVVVGPEKVNNPKPHPEMVETILARLGLRRDEVLYVGDMVIDIETARRAGVRVCVVTGGSSSRKELGAANPDFLIESFSKLAQILQQL